MGKLTYEQLEERVKHFASALERYGQHDKDCTWADQLDTGCGCWGCNCGFDSASIDAEQPLADCTTIWKPNVELTSRPTAAERTDE
jgi:hypothetical protein